MRATWNGVPIADSDETILLEGNHYFPPDSIDWDHLSATRMRSVCPWKGVARYYTVTASEQEGRNVAWSYPPSVAVDPEDPWPHGLLGRRRGAPVSSALAPRPRRRGGHPTTWSTSRGRSVAVTSGAAKTPG